MSCTRVTIRKATVWLMLSILASGTLGCYTMAPTAEVQSNGESLYPSLSYDGRFVAFFSEATNLVARDTNDVGDIFVHDTQSGMTTRVSVGENGAQADRESTFPSLSGNARYVVFSSAATNLVKNDTNNRPDVFVHDRATGATERVSISSSGGESQGVSYTYYPSISAEGDVVVFSSNAPNLVTGDTNGTYDIFVRDRKAGTTTRVSVGADGKEGDGPSLHGVVSGNGRYVAFQSRATNLVANDSNGAEDVFVHDRQTGTTTRISTDSQGRQVNGGSHRPAISHDGRVVAFSSEAADMVPEDTNGSEDVFVHDRETRSIERVNVGPGGIQSGVARLTAGDVGETVCCILSTACCVIVIINDRKSVVSASGDHVVFRSDVDDLVAHDTNAWQDIFVFDRKARTTTRVSVGSSGVQGNRESVHHGVSFDGRYIAFSSKASNLVPNDTNGLSDIFLHDRQTGTTKRVSVPSRSRYR
jgi:Tol biopolymer transport system component